MAISAKVKVSEVREGECVGFAQCRAQPKMTENRWILDSNTEEAMGGFGFS